MLCNREWDSTFDRDDGPCVVMHDATNVPFLNPSGANLQRAMWNDYCGMPCAKGGVSNQLCSWMQGMPLFTGRMTDSQMMKESKILQQQQAFSEADETSSKPFTNVFDKGFCNLLDAAVEGQKCLQPKYSKGEMQFEGKDTLCSACVAVMRSGNERAVQRCEMSWFVKRGCGFSLWDTSLVCDAWEAWTFQANFMCDKFL